MPCYHSNPLSLSGFFGPGSEFDIALRWQCPVGKNGFWHAAVHILWDSTPMKMEHHWCQVQNGQLTRHSPAEIRAGRDEHPLALVLRSPLVVTWSGENVVSTNRASNVDAVVLVDYDIRSLVEISSTVDLLAREYSVCNRVSGWVPEPLELADNL